MIKFFMTFVAFASLLIFSSLPANARQVYKWDEEHYKNGKFYVKKHDYPKAEKKNPAKSETGINVDEPVRIDHKGRIYRESEFPQPRHSPETNQ